MPQQNRSETERAALKKRFVPYRTAALSIAVAITAIVIVSVISAVGSALVGEEMSHLGMDGFALSAAEYAARSQMTPALYERLRRVPGVKNSTPLTMDAGAYTFGARSGSAVFWGVAPQADRIIALQLLSGRMIGSGDVSGARKVCVIDEQIAWQAFRRTSVAGKTIRLTINGIADGYKVVGVVRAQSSLLSSITGGVVPNFIYLPYSTLAYFGAKEGFDELVFTAADRTAPQRVETALAAALQGTGGNRSQFAFHDLSVQKDGITRLVRIGTTALTLIAGIALVVGGIAAGSSVRTAIMARRREIGIRKSLGASPHIIVREFLLEILVVTGLAALSGAVLSAAGCFGLLVLFSLPVKLDLPLLLGGIFATMVMAILFGILPARRAAQMKPADALRGEP